MLHPFVRKPVKPKPIISRPYKHLTLFPNPKPLSNDQNTNNSNLTRVISFSKKIKKQPETLGSGSGSASAHARHRQVHFKGKHHTKSFRCYMENELQLGPLADMIIPHRMDNDCESDAEQVEAGVRRLLGELEQAVRVSRRAEAAQPPECTTN